MVSIWVNQKKKEIRVSLVRRTQNQKGKERLSAMQLISQENPAMEINRFEGNGLEWLVLEGTPFVFGRGQDFERERGK